MREVHGDLEDHNNDKVLWKKRTAVQWTKSIDSALFWSSKRTKKTRRIRKRPSLWDKWQPATPRPSHGTRIRTRRCAEGNRRQIHLTRTKEHMTILNDVHKF